MTEEWGEDFGLDDSGLDDLGMDDLGMDDSDFSGEGADEAYDDVDSQEADPDQEILASVPEEDEGDSEKVNESDESDRDEVLSYPYDSTPPGGGRSSATKGPGVEGGRGLGYVHSATKKMDPKEVRKINRTVRFTTGSCMPFLNAVRRIMDGSFKEKRKKRKTRRR